MFKEGKQKKHKKKEQKRWWYLHNFGKEVKDKQISHKYISLRRGKKKKAEEKPWATVSHDKSDTQ